MLTYKGVSYHEDPEVGVVYFFTDSRLAFCKDCLAKDGKTVQIDEGTTLRSAMGCPCEHLRMMPSASISCAAFKALREADALDDLMEEIKNGDMPLGKEGKLITI